MKERTKERLLLIESLDIKEISKDIPSLIPELNMEMILNYSDDDFNSYIKWVKNNKNNKKD